MGDQPKLDESQMELSGQSTCLLIPHDLNEGDLCPQCGQERLSYNSLLNLVCDQCGFELGGAYT